MKPQLIYTLKVCLTTLAASIPITMLIGMGYVWMLMTFSPTDYSFAFRLTSWHLIIYVTTTALSMSLSHYFREKFGYIRFLNDRPISHSIVAFFLYLLISGVIHYLDIYQLLISYGPMFLISFISSKIFSI
ncbi:MAG TPA: hypothetical protein VKB19_15915 [Pedobacter sp.]|nr:hypothetical protein [Pedobacter sp.]